MKNIKTLTSVTLLALLLSFQAHADIEIDKQVEQIEPATSELGNQPPEIVSDQIEQQQEIVNEQINQDQQIVNEQINQQQEIVNEQTNPQEETATSLIVQDPQEDGDITIKRVKANAKILNEREELIDPLADENFDKFSNSKS